MPHQLDLAQAAGMKQSRVSVMETPGAANFNLETLVRLASVLKVGLVVKFVSFSEMLNWENNFSQDHFTVTGLDDDVDFLTPPVSTHALNQIAGITITNWQGFPLSKPAEVSYKFHVLTGTVQPVEINAEARNPMLKSINDLYQQAELTLSIPEDR
jgi:transcriptional regulator with XRE-family HTH domain